MSVLKIHCMKLKPTAVQRTDLEGNRKSGQSHPNAGAEDWFLPSFPSLIHGLM